MNNNIKPVTQSDLDGLKKVLDSCGLFPTAYLDEMIADYLNNIDSQDIWFTYLENHVPVAIGYCVPEKLTNGTYNLLAIGVSQHAQRKGIAYEMMNYIEKELKSRDGRILIVETSSDDAQVGARKLYEKIGFTQEAIIRDFWNKGEDKIVFRKKL